MEDNNNSLGESVSTRLVFRGFEVKTIKFVPAQRLLACNICYFLRDLSSFSSPIFFLQVISWCSAHGKKNV